MKEKILNAFKKLGFEMEDIEDLGYGFDYEGLHYLWMTSSDEDFLSIAVPALLDKSDSDELEFYQVIDELNSTLKYIKAYEFFGSMWLFYEREMIGEEDFEKLLPMMILRLDYAVRFLRDRGEDADRINDEDNATDENCGDNWIIDDVDILSDND